jgi:hypothetical protein
MFSEDSFFRRHKIITGFVTGILALIVLVVAFVGYRMIGPYRSYKIDFIKAGEGQKPGVLEVGVAKRDITPDLALYDTYNDVDNNNKYGSKTGLASHIKPLAGQDTYNDRNNNGKFDPVWIAGFGNTRPAKGVHDPLWARAIAFRNDGVTVVMVTLDAIGIFHDKFIDIRKRIDPSLKIDHVMFSSLHNHETPDTMGNWSDPYAVEFRSREHGADQSRVQGGRRGGREEPSTRGHVLRPRRDQSGRFCGRLAETDRDRQNRLLHALHETRHAGYRRNPGIVG